MFSPLASLASCTHVWKSADRWRGSGCAGHGFAYRGLVLNACAVSAPAAELIAVEVGEVVVVVLGKLDQIPMRVPVATA
jgi:hypothetical protein